MLQDVLLSNKPSLTRHVTSFKLSQHSHFSIHMFPLPVHFSQTSSTQHHTHNLHPTPTIPHTQAQEHLVVWYEAVLCSGVWQSRGDLVETSGALNNKKSILPFCIHLSTCESPFSLLSTSLLHPPSPSSRTPSSFPPPLPTPFSPSPSLPPPPSLSLLSLPPPLLPPLPLVTCPDQPSHEWVWCHKPESLGLRKS